MAIAEIAYMLTLKAKAIGAGCGAIDTGNTISAKIETVVFNIRGTINSNMAVLKLKEQGV